MAIAKRDKFDRKTGAFHLTTTSLIDPNDHIPYPSLQMATLHQPSNTNPSALSREINSFVTFMEEQQARIGAIDAGIAQLSRERVADSHLMSMSPPVGCPVQRLPDDVLLSVFFESLALAEPWPSLTCALGQPCLQ